ncbi:hypothetical protein Ahy_B02g057636 [Arachis hypogaea]|uniref:Auxin-induced protein n=1 Tax=Arachis hypogaea TaxID=3818 RepID=A0A445ACH2_ARAHY|nr:hypothetical protein Ahy_B02g057636 [Arachis hypogaea]
MGHGEKISPRSFHLHRHLLQHGEKNNNNINNNSSNKVFKDVIPKGFMAIKVGQGEEQQRFVVPVIYFNHPLFMQLLKEAEEEYVHYSFGKERKRIGKEELMGRK